LSRLFEPIHIQVNGPGDLDLKNGRVLVCWGLHQFSKNQLYAIDQAIMSGTPAIFLVSGVQVDPRRLAASEIPSSPADEMMEKYGLRIERNLIADNNCQVIRKDGQTAPILEHYPLFPVITRAMNGFDPEFEPTLMLQSQLLPWVSELTVLRPKQDSRVIAQFKKGISFLHPSVCPDPLPFNHFALVWSFPAPLNRRFLRHPKDDQSHPPIARIHQKSISSSLEPTISWANFKTRRVCPG